MLKFWNAPKQFILNSEIGDNMYQNESLQRKEKEEKQQKDKNEKNQNEEAVEEEREGEGTVTPVNSSGHLVPRRVSEEIGWGSEILRHHIFYSFSLKQSQ